MSLLAAARNLKKSMLIPCLMPSNVLPFYVTADIGFVECPSFAGLSTLLVQSNIARTCGMYVELRKKTLAAMLCSTKWEEIVARWLFTTHGSLSATFRAFTKLLWAAFINWGAVDHETRFELLWRALSSLSLYSSLLGSARWFRMA